MHAKLEGYPPPSRVACPLPPEYGGSVVIPYVVRAGDHLLKIAARRRFVADDAWNAPENAELRQARGSMHILQSGDLLSVPEPAPRRWLRVRIGAVNTFTGTLATMSMKITFVGRGGPVAGQPCRIRELPWLAGLATNGQGELTFEAPVTLDVATIDLTGMDTSFALRIGELDPMASGSGIWQRLLNLGYLTDIDLANEDRIELLRQALAHFQWAERLEPTGEVDSATIDLLTKRHGC